MSKNETYSLGIDFGTSNLKVGIFSSGRSVPLKLSNDISGKNYVPNIITRSKAKDGSYFFDIGDAAESKLIKSADAEQVFVFNIKKYLCDENWEVTFQDGFRSDAVGLCREMFEWLLRKVTTKKGGQKPCKTVITVPVSYSEMQTARLRRSATNAGLLIDAVISEPVAAFFAFDEFEDFIGSDECDDQYIMIIDFGGGTIDAALIGLFSENDEHKISVLSSGGIRFGGSDITEQIINDQLLPGLTSQQAAMVNDSRHHIFADVDAEKISLFSNEEDESNCSFYHDIQINYTIRAEQIYAYMDSLSLRKKITEMLDRMLEDADLDPDEDEIIVKFIGGGSCIPYMRELIESYFKTELDEYDEDEANSYVALGSAIYSGILAENKSITFENRSSFQIIGEDERCGILLSRNSLYGNKTSKKPVSATFINGKRYMKFYQRTDSAGEKIYLGYLDLSSSKYDNAVLLDLMILHDGRIEAELYDSSNHSLDKEIIITEEL